MPKFKCLLLGVLLFAVMQALSQDLAGSKPNIVLFFLDDNGFGDSSVYDKTVTETPNIQRIADSGLVFTDFHSGASVCTPSRAAMLTGRYAPRTGVGPNFGEESLYGLPLTEITMADVLASAGYQNHMIGKWHLGHAQAYNPTNRGFSSWLGLPYSGDMGCIDDMPQGCEPSWSRDVGQPACPALCPPDSATNVSKSNIAIPLYDIIGHNCSGQPCNTQIAQQPFPTMALNTLYTERAVSLIERHRPSEGPLFLYMAYAHTHTPLAYDPRYENASSRPGRQKVFGNTLAELDASIGAIYDSLDRQGMLDNTLVIITADNGPANLSSVACEAIGSVGPFSGAYQGEAQGGQGGSTAKTTSYEGGHRVIGVMSWKGRIQPRTTSQLASAIDLLPTFAALAGAELVQDRVYDGIDLAPVLFSEQLIQNRTVFHAVNTDLPAGRLGELKFFFKTEGSHQCIDGKKHPSGRSLEHNPPLVFNLTSDPAESTPITPDAETMQSILDVRSNALAHSINTTMRSTTNYETGGKAAWPCCNHKSACCRCL